MKFVDEEKKTIQKNVKKVKMRTIGKSRAPFPSHKWLYPHVVVSLER
jgi:hypothetical protein